MNTMNPLRPLLRPLRRSCCTRSSLTPFIPCRNFCETRRLCLRQLQRGQQSESPHQIHQLGQSFRRSYHQVLQFNHPNQSNNCSQYFQIQTCHRIKTRSQHQPIFSSLSSCVGNYPLGKSMNHFSSDSNNSSPQPPNPPSPEKPNKPSNPKELKQPSKPKTPKKITIQTLSAKKRRGEKITVVTAYDYPSAVHVDRAGIDVILVGDSCAMVELGLENTQPITLDQMLHHCQAVKRGAPNRPLLVGDMPFGSYEFKDGDVALRNAYRMVKEGGMDAVKFEGGTKARAEIVRHVVEGGVPVLGHVGLTPQSIGLLGGFRSQGRTASRALTLLHDALRLQDAGAFAIVLECIPSNVASIITERLEVPTIGIGAGGGTSGQVLVFHDMLGIMSCPEQEGFLPKFCKEFSNVGVEIRSGLERFKEEVEGGVFPGERYSPYSMSVEEKETFDRLVQVKEDDNVDGITIKEVGKVHTVSEDDSDSEIVYGGSNKNGQR